MEVVFAVAGCLLGGVGAFALVQAWFELAASRAVTRRASTFDPKASVLSWMELLGHWAPVARLSNLAALQGPSLRLRDALAAAGWTLTRRGAVAAALAATLALGAAGAVVSLSPLGALVGAGAALALALALVGKHERAVRDEIAAQMPEVLRSLSAALGAGKSLPQAIEHVGRNVGEPMGSQFLKTSFEIKGGRSVDEAVGALCERVEAPGMALLGTSLQISQRTGSSLNDLFARTAHMVGETVALRRELLVKTSQVRLSAKVVAAMPVILAGALVLVSPDYRAGLALPAGRACLAVAALLDIVALGIVWRLMRRSLA